MAFSCGFFNSKNLDRTYTAENFNDYLSSIICNGIQDTYGQSFKLTAGSSGLSVVLGTGKAWINGHYFINDSRYTIDLSEYQDESLPRYVGIAIYLDTTESVRSVTLKLFPGTPAESPQLPSIAKKFCILLMVVVSVRMDILIGTTYIRDATCIGFCVNELLSIIENTSLMGIPYPPAIKKAIEVLQKRAAHIDDEIQEMIDNMEEDKK